ncbi:MAG: nitrilase-related carbon-nitrogen hydrolase [Pseudoxanthomonas sp.]
MPLLRKLIVAVAAVVLVHLSVALVPAWWAAWLAPLPLLWLALSAPVRTARWWLLAVLLAATSAYLPYFRLVMPVPAAVLSWLGVALVWLAVVMCARRIALTRGIGWAALAYPAAWAAVDTLMAAWLPDGNWGSLAYSQADVLPVLQWASLFGVAGLLFVLCLPASAAAVLLLRPGARAAKVGLAAAVALALAAVLGFGQWRLQQPPVGKAMRVGLASVDDPIGVHARPGYALAIRARYDDWVARLAGQGAQLVVLPEKIAVLAPAAAPEWQRHFAALAAQHRLWLEVGIAIDDGRHPRNYAWLFDPVGRRVEDYQKHIMAPPERAEGYGVGDAWSVHAIDGVRYGLAVCKDMHFASLGRQYGRLDVGAMLVPAWDFAYVDGWMGSRMTLVRGVENGYAVVRAAREGLLIVSDPYGRVLAQARSASLPGSALLADLRTGPRLPTLYTRIGNLFGWSCVALVLALLVLAWLRPTAAPAR